MSSKKIEPPSSKDEYTRAVLELVFMMTPKVYPCKKCGWPVITGLACSTCMDGNPHESTRELSTALTPS